MKSIWQSITTLLFIITATTIIPTTAIAETNMDRAFNKLDTNKNQLIDTTEARNNKSLLNDFTAMDKDGNNELDRTEFSAFESFESNSPPVTETHKTEAPPLE